LNAWFWIVSLALRLFFQAAHFLFYGTWETKFQKLLIWNLHSSAKLLVVLFGACKFDRDVSTTQTNRKDKCLAVSLTFDTRMANFVAFLWWRYYLQQDRHSQGNVREKTKFYEVREKSRNFSKSQGNSLLFSKSIKKKGNLLVIKSNVLDQERNEVENKGR